MNEYVKWGGAGIAIAVAGVAIIASEILAGLQTGDPLMVIYGVAGVIATLTAIAIIAPSFRDAPEVADHD